jgi:hypothetical protein
MAQSRRPQRHLIFFDVGWAEIADISSTHATAGLCSVAAAVDTQ